jgi:hypothetical protein
MAERLSLLFDRAVEASLRHVAIDAALRGQEVGARWRRSDRSVRRQSGPLLDPPASRSDDVCGQSAKKVRPTARARSRGPFSRCRDAPDEAAGVGPDQCANPPGAPVRVGLNPDLIGRTAQPARRAPNVGTLSGSGRERAAPSCARAPRPALRSMRRSLPRCWTDHRTAKPALAHICGSFCPALSRRRAVLNLRVIARTSPGLVRKRPG